MLEKDTIMNEKEKTSVSYSKIKTYSQCKEMYRQIYFVLKDIEGHNVVDEKSAFIGTLIQHCFDCHLKYLIKNVMDYELIDNHLNLIRGDLEVLINNHTRSLVFPLQDLQIRTEPLIILQPLNKVFNISHKNNSTSFEVTKSTILEFVLKAFKNNFDFIFKDLLGRDDIIAHDLIHKAPLETEYQLSIETNKFKYTGYIDFIWNRPTHPHYIKVFPTLILDGKLNMSLLDPDITQLRMYASSLALKPDETLFGFVNYTRKESKIYRGSVPRIRHQINYEGLLDELYDFVDETDNHDDNIPYNTTPSSIGKVTGYCKYCPIQDTCEKVQPTYKETDYDYDDDLFDETDLSHRV